MSTTETYAARKADYKNWSKIELDDALDQADDVAAMLSGHLNGDPEPATYDVNDLRRQTLRLVWALSQVREQSDAIFNRAMELAGQVAEHEHAHEVIHPADRARLLARQSRDLRDVVAQRVDRIAAIPAREAASQLDGLADLLADLGDEA